MDANQSLTNPYPEREITSKDIANSLRTFTRFCLKKWWFIFLLGLLGIVAGITWAWLKKAEYQSRLTFALDDKSAGIGGALSLASDLGFSVGGGRDVFAGENITVILNSRRIIESVLLMADTANGKHRSLADYFQEINGGSESTVKASKEGMALVHFPLNLPREKFTMLQDSVLFAMYENIVKKRLTITKPDRKLNYYEVTFLAREQRFSKIFIEKLVAETKKFYTELRSKKSREALLVLEERVASVKGTARSAIGAQASVKDANINPAFASANAVVAQKQIDVAAYGKAYEELFKLLELARYQYLTDIPLLQIIDEPNYPIKKIKPGRLKSGLIGGLIAGLLSLVFVWFMWLKSKQQPLKEQS